MKKTLLLALMAAFLFAAPGVRAEDKPMKEKGMKCPAMKTEALSGTVLSVDKVKDKKAGAKMQQVTLKTSRGEQKVLLCLAKSDASNVKVGDKLDLQVCKGPGEKLGKGVKYCAMEGTCNGSAMKCNMKACPMMKGKDDAAKAKKDAEAKKAKAEKKAKEEKAKAKEKKAKAGKKAKEGTTAGKKEVKKAKKMTRAERLAERQAKRDAALGITPVPDKK